MSDKTVFRLVTAISIFVFIVVVILNQKVLPRPEVMPSFVTFLPTLNAIINGTCTILLLLSLWAIKKKNIALHKKINLTAFVLSSLFLVSYIMYHWMALETTFPKDNPLRPVYLFILLTHIVLAAIVLPLILISFYFGLKNEITKHRKIVRFSYPIWLYVTITGVVVYLMIKPYYPF
jgi:putative membrane protein